MIGCIEYGSDRSMNQADDGETKDLAAALPPRGRYYHLKRFALACAGVPARAVGRGGAQRERVRPPRPGRRSPQRARREHRCRPGRSGPRGHDGDLRGPEAGLHPGRRSGALRPRGRGGDRDSARLCAGAVLLELRVSLVLDVSEPEPEPVPGRGSAAGGLGLGHVRTRLRGPGAAGDSPSRTATRGRAPGAPSRRRACR